MVVAVLQYSPCICLERLRKTKTSVKLAGLRNRESKLSPLEYETRVVTSTHQVVKVYSAIFRFCSYKQDGCFLQSTIAPNQRSQHCPSQGISPQKKNFFVWQEIPSAKILVPHLGGSRHRETMLTRQYPSSGNA